MALDYTKCAKEIADIIGGGANVVSAAHCATRLRLVTVDNNKVDKKKLENVDGVKGVFESNGQLQIIIGTGTVNKVYDEFLKYTGVSEATKDEVKAAAAAKKPVWYRMIKSLGDVFVPILPAIVASGLMMGIVEALGKAIPGFSDSDWYQFLDMVSNTAFAFLPVIVAVSAARVFGGNIFLGAVIGLMMVHTSLLNGWNVGSADAINSFFGVTNGEIPEWHLFGNLKIGDYTFLSISRHGYQGHVIPVMISVYFMSKLENWLHKHVIEMLDLFVTPLVTVLCTALLTFTVIGPVFAWLETGVLAGAKFLVQNPFGAFAIGVIYPVTVVMGLHHMYNVIEAGMLAEGALNTWMPIASAANFAQFGACLAVAVKSKNAKTKSVAVPSALSASLGITEPAIFGVNLRFMKPFVCAMIGGGVGALVGAFMGIGATAYGVTGIPGFLTINNPLLYCILLAVSFAISFGLTMVVFKEEEPEAVVEGTDKKGGAAISANAAASTPSKTENKALEANGATTAPFEQKVVMTAGGANVYAPVTGNVIPEEKIPDETFAQGVLGGGVGIEPSEGIVYAPFDGEISSIADAHHALGITGPADMELLIHVGVDTVKLNGGPFTLFVKEGDTITKGQKLMTFDREAIKNAGYSDTVAVLLTNSDDFEDFKVEIGK